MTGSKPSSTDPSPRTSSRPLLFLSASHLIHVHTLLATFAFSSTFFLSCTLHYKQIVKNSVAQYPQEWLPSVSASIGDWLPERTWFQILIAACSGPRFALIGLQWLATRRRRRRRTGEGEKGGIRRGEGRRVKLEMELEEWVAIVGVIRTFCCGGWVYVTSTDNHDFHDVAMIAYMLLTLPWMLGTIASTPTGRESGNQIVVLRRKFLASGFFLTLIPLIYFYISHSVHRVPGAYSSYAIFEWALVAWDVGFDALGASLEEVKRMKVGVLFFDAGTEVDGWVGDKDVPLDSENEDQPSFDGTLHPARETPNGPKMFEYPPELAGWTTSNVEGNNPITGWRADLRTLIAFVVDVYLYFCFWAIFTSLGLTLFYFSVWKLALSGSELSLLSLLSPYLLSSSRISRFATSRHGQTKLRIAGLGLGLTAFLVNSPAGRVIMVMTACAIMWLQFVGGLKRLKGGRAAGTEGIYFIMGLFTHVTVKYLYHSVNPLWAMTALSACHWNWIGLFLAAVATYEKAIRPLRLEPQPPIPIKTKEPKTHISAPVLPLALGLGSLMFLIQTLFNDLTTIIAWSWTGFPMDGINTPSYIHGPLVFASSAMGLIQAMQPHSAFIDLTALLWTYLLVNYNDLPSFIGGCCILIIIIPRVPAFVRAASAGHISSIFGGAMAVLILLDVVSVVTVAYAFVPLGQYVRERTDVTMYFSISCFIWGSWIADKVLRQSILTPDAETTHRRSSRINKLALFTTVLFGLLLSAKSALLQLRPAPQPYHPDTGIFTGGIWTVHFGMDEEGRESQRRMMDLITEMEVDVVGLLESDLHRFVYGSRDLTRLMAEEAGYYVDTGPGPDKHTWGAALLSKFPIIESTHHLLPSPQGELAPAIHAKLLIHGQVVNVIVSHNGQEEDALDRQLQTEAIAKITRESYPEPFLFLGYVVTETGAGRPAPYTILMTDGKLWDIEISDYDRWCEYIAFRGLWRIGYARVSHGDITDTELQVGKFIVPHPDYNPLSYTTNEELYHHVYEDDLPVHWRFPQQFRGNGTRGHRYHVWDGPLLYAPPDIFYERHRECVQEYRREHPEAAAALPKRDDHIWPCPTTDWTWKVPIEPEDNVF